MELDRKPSDEKVRQMIELRDLASFPCGFNKKPRTRHGFNDAI
jgi:hypothetical protein